MAEEIKMLGVQEGMEDIAEGIVDYAAKYIFAEMRKHAPVDTGKMKGQLDIVVDGRFGRTIVSPTEYTGYVEYGHGFNSENFTPGSELTTWPAKEKRLQGKAGKAVTNVARIESQTLPFMRPAIYKFIAHAESLSGEEWATKLKVGGQRNDKG